MKTLTINDLPMTEELGCEAMAGVRGGMHEMFYTPYYWGGYVDASTQNASFDAVQQINQGQNVVTNVGNNVAVLGGIASPSVAVTATQNAGINNNVFF